MSAEEQSTYDPLISGLEPESFDTVFQELFSGVKNYFAVANDEPETPPVTESLSGYRLDENTPQPSSAFDITQPEPPEVVEQPPSNRTRRYAMFRCGMCPEIFVSEFSLEYHEARMHQGMFSWSCTECEIQFDDLRYASDHALMTHGDGEMPVYDTSHFQYRKQGLAMFMQLITRRSSDFVKDYLVSRDKRSIMTTAYFTYSKCEVQSVYAGNIGLLIYHQARADLLKDHPMGVLLDLVACLKKYFIYGNCIRRVTLITYNSPTTVYKTLTFTQLPVRGKKIRPARPGTTLRDVVAKLPQRAPPTAPSYLVRSNVRVDPYDQQRVRPILRVPIGPRFRPDPIPIRQPNPSVYQPSIQVQQ